MGTKGCIDDIYVIKNTAGNETEVKVYTPKTLHFDGDECIMQNFTSSLQNPNAESIKYNAELPPYSFKYFFGVLPFCLRKILIK